jgi:hypothetical protein
VDRIQPIGPRPPQPPAIPAVRRSDGSTEKRDREGSQQQRRRRAPVPDLPAPPDDGLPHIDVRV